MSRGEAVAPIFDRSLEKRGERISILRTRPKKSSKKCLSLLPPARIPQALGQPSAGPSDDSSKRRDWCYKSQWYGCCEVLVQKERLPLGAVKGAGK